MKRSTIMIQDEVNTKLRRKQAYLIKTTNEYISFSNVVNMVLTGQIKL